MKSKVVFILSILSIALVVALFLLFSGNSEVMDEINHASEEIIIAEQKISEVSNDKETAMALQRLSEAKALLDDANDAYDSRDYDLALELAEMSRDYAQESRMEYIGKTATDLDINLDDEINSEGITLAELESHNDEDSCWVIYKDNVYDITSYIPRHPGGESEIKRHCGLTSFQTAFISQHGESKVDKFMSEATFIGEFIS